MKEHESECMTVFQLTFVLKCLMNEWVIFVCLPSKTKYIHNLYVEMNEYVVLLFVCLFLIDKAIIKKKNNMSVFVVCFCVLLIVMHAFEIKV